MLLRRLQHFSHCASRHSCCTSTTTSSSSAYRRLSSPAAQGHLSRRLRRTLVTVRPRGAHAHAQPAAVSPGMPAAGPHALAPHRLLRTWAAQLASQPQLADRELAQHSHEPSQSAHPHAADLPPQPQPGAADSTEPSAALPRSLPKQFVLGGQVTSPGPDMRAFEQQYNRESVLAVSLTLPQAKRSTAGKTKSTTVASKDFKLQFKFDVWAPALKREIGLLREQMAPKSDDKRLNRRKNAAREPFSILFSSSLSDADIAHIVLTNVQQNTLNNPYGCQLMGIEAEVGKALNCAIFVKQSTEHGADKCISHVYARYLELYNDRERWRTESPAAFWRQQCREFYAANPHVEAAQQHISYSDSVIRIWGKALVQMLVDTALARDLTKDRKDVGPAFLREHSLLPGLPKRIVKLRCSDTVLRFTTGQRQRGTSGLLFSMQDRVFDSSRLPMTVPPVPWTATNQGAYLISPVIIARTEEFFDQITVLEQIDSRLDRFFDAITTVSSVAWRVNDKIANLVTKLHKTGKGYPKLDIVPELLRFKDFQKKPAIANLDYKAQRQEFKVADLENYGLRCSLTYQLAVANWLHNRPFWLPHSVDFRGRAYPIPPYLSHMGGDLSRAMLVFDEGKPLGDNGLRWLKMHLANVYGKDKLSFDDRIKFIDDNMAHIRKAVESPLLGIDNELNPPWWLSADKPWQTLATCFELVAALDSPDPTQFISHYPVHQDGTCNGLQHYSVLGGDVEGARQVNVLPTPGRDVPADVYTAVARRVDAALAKVAAGELDSFPESSRAGLQAAQETAKKLLTHGPIPRKVIKQTVMTTVYGVTYIGAREQIANQLEDHGFSDGTDEDIWPKSSLLAKLVFLSLGQIFSRASAIQKWLADQAGIIARSGAAVAWQTPLGFTAVEPYVKQERHKLTVRTQETTKDQGPYTPDARKQRTAFPPNFIHSFDATHMFYTALRCREAGVTFAAVHDSFWTHAATVDEMSRFTREEFKRLHSEPILQNLYEFFKIHYEGRPLKNGQVVITPPPERGKHMDLNEVLESPFFFS